jgi:hypothetical protein
VDELSGFALDLDNRPCDTSLRHQEAEPNSPVEQIPEARENTPKIAITRSVGGEWNIQTLLFQQSVGQAP